LGAPGAGKGTQADILASRLGLAHVASGDLFREALKKKTELGLLAKSYMDKGELVPDNVTISMILQRLERDDCARGVILDGFPRTLEQARALDTALAGLNRKIDRVLYIKVSEDELVRRLSGRLICRECQANYHETAFPPAEAGKCDKCGGELYKRPDDAIETVKRRVEVYMEQTAPLINYYSQAGILTEINGKQPIEAVTNDLVNALKE